MIKTVDIEYVGIEDIQEIIDDIYAVIKEGHHVYFNMMSSGNITYIDVFIMLGGFDADKAYDFKFEFSMTGNDDDVNTMNDCKTVLRSLLIE